MINLDKMLFFDIETEPNSLVKDHMPEFSAPTNYKDSAKIARYVEEKEAAFVDKAALDIDFARVSAIGVAMGDNEIQAVLVGVDQTEKDTLAWFWSLVSQAKTICGYNIVGFDLPIIQRRSFLLGITPTRRLFDLKPWDAFTLDLMRRFYHSGYGPGVKYRGLKAVCAMFGIENALPDLDGSQAVEMDEEMLRKYVQNDVLITRELARRMKGHYW